MADHDTLHTDLVSLHHQMDALWMRYLTLLDEYTAAQASIKKDLASGFFSLAQANFNSSGRRYGQDYFDDRAVASVRVHVSEGRDGASMTIVQPVLEGQKADISDATSKTETKSRKGNNIAGTSSSEKLATEERHQLPSPESTPEPKTPESLDLKRDSGLQGEKPTDMTDETISADKSANKDVHDPIRWFGILVPPPLRSAQKSFSAAVRDELGIISAANASRDLRETEAQIRKLRKAIKKADKGMRSEKQGGE